MSVYVVTGCAGFIGSHLSEALLSDGHRVIGVDAFRDYYDTNLKRDNLHNIRAHKNFCLLDCDLAECDVDEIVSSCEGIFHLAAQPGVRGSWGSSFDIYSRDNVLVSQRVFDAAAKRGVRVVFASSSSVYGNAERYPTPEEQTPSPMSPYGVTKLCCEELAATYKRSFDLDYVALRYFTVYGPRQRPDMACGRMLRALTEGAPFFLLGDGKQSRDVTFVGDAVSATRAAMDQSDPSPTYNVGGGSETSILALISLAERLVGRNLDVRRQKVAVGDVRRTGADTTRIRDELGWNPATNLQEGLRAHLDWMLPGYVVTRTAPVPERVLG